MRSLLKRLLLWIFGIDKAVLKMSSEIKALQALPLPVRYIEVTPCDETDKNYIRDLAAIAGNERFRYFLFTVRESIVEGLEKAGPDAVDLKAQLVGELKAINIIRALLEKAIMKNAAVQE